MKQSLFFALAVSSLSVAAVAQPVDANKLLVDAKAHFAPLAPAPKSDGDPRVELGRRLFFETRVSQDGNISCGHCHQSDLGGADGLEKAVGVFGKVNARNAPSVFNVGLQFKAHWRGDRESLEEQAEKSLVNPAAFGNPDLATPVAKLKTIPAYGPAFAKVFPGDADPVNSKNWGAAIAAFERTLVTPGRFDAFLAGNVTALSDAEKEGLRKFVDVGCAGCHDGVGLGGKSFQKFGVAEDYWKETGVQTPDKGRADVTKNDADLYVFKVPPLRNVAKTAPYFHDGSVKDLGRAVEIMGKTQLGVQIPEKDVKAIVAFLGALTGPAPANYSALEPYPDAPAAKP